MSYEHGKEAVAFDLEAGGVYDDISPELRAIGGSDTILLHAFQPMWMNDHLATLLALLNDLQEGVVPEEENSE